MHYCCCLYIMISNIPFGYTNTHTNLSHPSSRLFIFHTLGSVGLIIQDDTQYHKMLEYKAILSIQYNIHVNFHLCLCAAYARICSHGPHPITTPIPHTSDPAPVSWDPLPSHKRMPCPGGWQLGHTNSEVCQHEAFGLIIMSFDSLPRKLRGHCDLSWLLGCPSLQSGHCPGHLWDDTLCDAYVTLIISYL